MYTIKRTRTEKKSIVFQDTYAIESTNLQDALEFYLRVCNKEMQWLLLSNIKVKVQLFKNDELRNEIDIHIKKSK